MCETTECTCRCRCCRSLAPVLRARLLARLVYAENGCLLWTGWKDRAGYGRMNLDGRAIATHRTAYELFVGPIAEDLTIDHLCRVKACANPAHMEVVTRAENGRRGAEISVAARRARARHRAQLVPA